MARASQSSLLKSFLTPQAVLGLATSKTASTKVAYIYKNKIKNNKDEHQTPRALEKVNIHNIEYNIIYIYL